MELTYRAIERGFRVVEVPIVFRDRRVGSSKMSRAIVLEAMWLVPLLPLGEGVGEAVAAAPSFAILLKY